MDIEQLLHEFAAQNKVVGKGPLCVMLVITRYAITNGLPINADDLLTANGGQVAGLSKASVQSILLSHGINSVLAEEGGRTSRGSVGMMKRYVAFLNSLDRVDITDLKYIERWWVSRVQEYFASMPLTLKYDPLKSLRSVIKDLFQQAKQRQASGRGTMVVGSVLQHMVGAKISVLLGDSIEHHGASVADAQTNRHGDYVIDDVVVHVTTSPSEALLRKCARNIEIGMRPVIITLEKGVSAAELAAEEIGIADKVDVFEAEQFIAGNIYEIGRFVRRNRRITAVQLVEAYNRIIDSCETDPSLRIHMPQ